MRTRGQNGVIFVVFWTYLKSKSELQVGQCKQVDVVMPHLVDRGSFRDNLNHVIAVSHRLNFKSQNQSFAHTILDARDSCRTQTEYLSGFTVGDINLQRCAGDVFIVYNRTIVLAVLIESRL